VKKRKLYEPRVSNYNYDLSLLGMESDFSVISENSVLKIPKPIKKPGRVKRLLPVFVDVIVVFLQLTIAVGIFYFAYLYKNR